MQAQGLDNGLMMDVVGDAKKAGKGAIRQLDSPRLIKQQKPFGHAVKQRILLRLELIEGVELNLLEFLDFALGRLVCFREMPTPPEMHKNHRCQSENC